MIGKLKVRALEMIRNDVVDWSIIQSTVFFFKQKTAYEIQYGLVGSEMCIRDSSKALYKENEKIIKTIICMKK